MCGIAGIWHRGGEPAPAQREADRALVRRMLASIGYRGPDDEGIESAGRATLGVRRLAILDVAGGHQPLCDAGRRVWAMQNGEQFEYPRLRRELASRYPLHTGTDTELLPYLWLERGPDCVHELTHGMFALAVHDTADGALLLARDPLGVKPLYLADRGERVLFASEIKALLCDPEMPRALDLEALGDYLALGWIPGEATPFTAIRKVRPGHRILLAPGSTGCQQERWWPLPRFFTRPAAPADDLVAEAARLVRASAEMMLLSDRPLGVLLSGGLDSSVLVALLPEDLRREIRTFSIGFEDGGHHDERAHARAVAAHLGTRHRELTVPLDVAAELPELVRRLDEPLADPAALPGHLVARAASAEVTVLLSGTGGDEVFGGYHRYRLPGLLRRAGLVPRAAAGALARALGDRDQHRRSAAGERLVHVRKLLEARSRGSYLDAYLSTFAPAPAERWAEALALPVHPAGATAAMERRLRALGLGDAGEEETSFVVDHLFYVPDDLLLKEDRTTMAASVEGRVPFLDPSVVEFGASLPLATRFEGDRGKRLLRAIARDRLPAGIAARPKHGFSAPIEDWLRGPLRDLQGDVFAGAGSGLFRADVLRRWRDEHQAGRDRSGALWAALSFELWWRLVGAAAPAELEAAGRPLAGRAS